MASPTHHKAHILHHTASKLLVPKYKFLFVVVDKQEQLWFQLTSNCAQLEGVTWSDEIGLIKVNSIVTEKSSVLVGYKKEEADARSRLKYGFMSKLTLICQI